MGFRYFFIMLAIFAFACQPQRKKAIDSGEAVIFHLDSLEQKMADTFYRHQINGCFILYDLQNDSSYVYNESRSNESFLPASTFKILNSLIALECGVVANADEVIAWDGVERSMPAWNQDHNMRSAIKVSAVWFYQELARRIGEERMQLWVDSVGYGNKNISNQIDNFWLVGELRISPQEQVDFLHKLITEDLPFSKDHIQTVKEILIEDQNDQYIFLAKTGWADFGQPVGWYDGYIEIHGMTFIFVNNIDINSSDDASARKKITKEILDYAFQLDLKI